MWVTSVVAPLWTSAISFPLGIPAAPTATGCCKGEEGHGRAGDGSEGGWKAWGPHTHPCPLGSSLGVEKTLLLPKEGKGACVV